MNAKTEKKEYTECNHFYSRQGQECVVSVAGGERPRHTDHNVEDLYLQATYRISIHKFPMSHEPLAVSQYADLPVLAFLRSCDTSSVAAKVRIQSSSSRLTK